MRLPEGVTGLRWHIDTHMVDIEQGEFLRRCYVEGWVDIEATVDVVAELTRTANDQKREQLLEFRAIFPMPLTPFAPDLSGLGFTIAGTPEDQDRINVVHKALWGTPWSEDKHKQAGGNRKALSRIGDTLIACGAIYYGADLVSFDGPLCAHSVNLKVDFPDFRIIPVADANREVKEAIEFARECAIVYPDEPDYRGLPDWPSPTDLTERP